MLPLVFKTSVGPMRSRVGSIPIRLRHFLEKQKHMKQAQLRRVGGGLGLIIGLGLCVYGVSGRSIAVLKGPAPEQAPTFQTQQERENATVSLRETALTKEASIGGIVRWASGDLQQAYGLNAAGEKVDASGKKAKPKCKT